MTNIIIGNIIALIASILMVYSGILKEKKKILYIQTIQIGLFVIGNLVLGGITGAIINALGCIKNILYYKDKLGLKEKIIITVLAVVLSFVLRMFPEWTDELCKSEISGRFVPWYLFPDDRSMETGEGFWCRDL